MTTEMLEESRVILEDKRDEYIWSTYFSFGTIIYSATV